MKGFGLPARQKNIALRLEVDPAIPDFVMGDEGSLRQILVNLIGNAIKFTAAGEVAVEVSPEDSKAAQIHFAVRRYRHRDSGGETIRHLRCLFTSRRIDHAAVRRNRPGAYDFRPSGRGHARAPVGGERSGQGSCFHFTICLEKSRETLPEPLPQVAPSPLQTVVSPRRILLAEDTS